MAQKPTTTASVSTSTRKKYWKDFLKQVIVRIDFAEPLAIPKKGPSTKIIAALKKEYPVPQLDVKQIKEVAITLSGQPRETFREIREWNYHSKKRNKRAVITKECMLIEFTKYNSFEVLRNDFFSFVDALYADFKEVQVKRLGLRYIDEIELKEPNPTEWDKYFDKNLLCSLKIVDDPSTLVRSLHIIEQKFDDESRIRFQFGIPNPDYPAPIHRKIFLLDTDVYCSLLLTQEEIKQYIDTFHNRCIDIFERLITDEFRKKMGGVKRGR